MGIVQRIDGSVVKYIIIETEYDVIWDVEEKMNSGVRPECVMQPAS
jgi:hypothetical protein